MNTSTYVVNFSYFGIPTSHTIADSGLSITDSPLSMSYCEGVTGRLRPLSAPLTAAMFEETRSVNLSRNIII